MRMYISFFVRDEHAATALLMTTNAPLADMPKECSALCKELTAKLFKENMWLKRKLENLEAGA